MSLRQRPTPSNQNPTTTAATSPPRAATGTALSQALQTTAHLANLLPTGTLLAFQILTPIFTKNGLCDSTTRTLTLTLLIVLSLSCLLASFTDSFRATDGRVYYGFITLKGMWLFDYPANLSPLPDTRKYRLIFLDFVHAILSLLVFIVVSLRDKNVVSCLYPMPGIEVQEVLDIVPIGVGFVCSLLFVVFPTKRHGIGYPLTKDA